MNTRFIQVITSLFGLALVGGCIADSSLRRDRDQMSTESESELTRSKSSRQAEPPNITYRPGG